MSTHSIAGGSSRPLGLAVAALVVGAALVLLAGQATAAAATTTKTFAFTGDAQNWSVPAGVTSATFDLYGAEGGSSGSEFNPVQGGKGARVHATLAVTPGVTLQVLVGGKGGSNGNEGGFNGGGSGTGSGGSTISGGGGGASDVRLAPGALTNRLLVAAGGGGGGGCGVGDVPPEVCGRAGGAGGASAAAGGAGADFDDPTRGGAGGAAGTDTAGGAGGTGGEVGGTGGNGGNGGNGAPGQGGAVGVGSYPAGEGGGGGGGYYGGGGGGGGAFDVVFEPFASRGAGGGGGGGGSNLVTGTGITVENGARSGDGLVTITYTVSNAAPHCSAVTATPNVLQPAIRDQFKLITLSGATDADGDTLSFHIGAVTQDEPVGFFGGRRQDAQLTAAGADSNQVRLRAERNPLGNGRVYRIAYAVSDGRGGSCSGVAKVAVPRKKGQPATDDGDTHSWNSFTGKRL